jgi:hypothetical protein
MTTKSTSQAALSPQALEEARTQLGRVQPLASAERMWDRLFTAAERAQLGGNLLEAWRRLGTMGMWANVRGVSADEALLEIALKLGQPR